MPDLLADIGNSRVHLARIEAGVLTRAVAVPHGPDAADAWDGFWPEESPTRLAAVSVRGPRLEAFSDWSQQRFGLRPRVLGVDLASALPLRVDRPEQVGQDRIANGLWAARTYPTRTVVVVDAGTAVTFDVVSGGAFVGGSIAPGLATGAWALSERTRGRLPRVDVPTRPPALGRDTEACLRAGLFYGLTGLIQATCQQLALELGQPLHVVATGGDAALIATGCDRVDEVVPQLTLLGLRHALDEAGSD